MRHSTRSQQLSRPTDQRDALLGSLVRNLVIHGQIRTTHARAKEAQRVAEHLVSLGKDGSIASRRLAFRVLQDRTLVKQLFSEIAPRFLDVSSGYTRVMRLATRRGDGAQIALLAFSRLPAIQPAISEGPKPAQAPKTPSTPTQPASEKTKKAADKESKGLFEGLRKLWTRKGKGSAAS